MKMKFDFLNRIKVQKKLYFIFFISVFIPVITIGSYLVYNTRSLLTNHYKEQVHSDGIRVRSTLLDLTTNIYKQATTISGNNNLAELLSIDAPLYSEGEFTIKEHEILAPLLTENGSIQYFSIYTYNPCLPEGKYIHQITDEIQNEDWYQRAFHSVAPFWSEINYMDDFGNQTAALCLHSRIFLPEIQSFAILNLTVNNNYIKNRIENHDLTTVLYLNKDIVYQSEANSSIPSMADYITNSQKEYTGIVHTDNTKTVASISTLESTQYDDIFLIVSINDHAIPYINRITVLYCLILTLIILVATIFIYLFSSYFSGRIRTLQTAMHSAGQGNYEITDSFSGTDELSDVFTDMNRMIQTILYKEESIYQARLQTQELTAKQWQMEFKMLSSQINSHFLYNTLETIRMRAVKARNHEVANAIKLLGKYMRYALENTVTSYTTLDKELDHLFIYLSIQKLRFHDKINYSIRIQPGISIHDYPILPLLLQPIIENAVLHGLEETEEHGKIIIHISANDTLLWIDIYDNGCGISPSNLEQIRQTIYHHPEKSSKNIGLYNIYQRIRLCYGSKYGFTIQSKENMGTLVKITLPLHMTRKENIK